MSMVFRTNCLTKRYGEQLAVNQLSLNIEKGEIYGLIGKNGAGKTTIMKMASGLIYPTSGDMELFESNQLNKGRKRIGCLIEQPSIYPDMTASQHLIYYNKLLGISDFRNVEETLELVGLSDTGNKKARHFSLGMKQRLSIATTLLGNPDFLILDEPINGLDPSGIVEIRELILKLNQDNDITIMISSHILGELNKISTKYGIINNGVLVDEFHTSELEKRCKKCLSLEVNNTEKASYILENKLGITDFQIFGQGKLCIYNKIDEPEQINKALVEHDILVSKLCFDGQDIENYFVKLMGGDFHD